MSKGLCIRDIHVEYGSRVALSGISLDVAPAQIVSLVGSNGAGKTSTLRAIMGLRSPSKGEISFGGARIDGMSTPEIVARGIALSPEGRRVFPRMSVHDNLFVGGYLQPQGAHLHKSVERMFDFFPKLRQRRSQMAGSLSGGEQQMLAIARALMAAPKVLLLDEPSLGLAPIMVQEIGRLIQTINKEQGLSIVLVEQNASLALRLCHYAYVLENGRIALSGPGPELVKSDYVQRAYLGV
ncbi:MULTISPECIES: ABC transporter ATP-binding protein [Bradyrhizobium]|jgi:branched-chain amino acid transport system ATP-binding protein|uniref:Amino acid/amide ABC transporter ATP-binding protein 2, HAAT family n=2 Tax=Bradyrhizobium TaxID=374 RepID=A0ABY0PE46_9BRAD|nr:MULTISPECIES: ABC transporter ATP-binding protein [Bradyrhizobium]SDI15379.1 amino acid/amide ABC transporter ATP-binding protein 2, HAAT family [Bradyrhizobium ottawaense]SED78392.1 amino acid/amide ABC transporter ATP-binding protein 2, HAAT family [Bradyrhizobium lablabi]SHL73938.1 amino acid/amide ABC transporter ATP-binding protein 2, HAAT family [Bradyrhizobium lablabi]